jgi:hypothetical protein
MAPGAAGRSRVCGRLDPFVPRTESRSTMPRISLSALLPRAAARLRRLGRDAGAATAEYAVVIMAAVGFAGLLVVILKSGAVQGMLTDLVHRALTVAG